MTQNKREVGTPVTIDDVAREAGVSYATVSRVINNTARVRPDKHDRVVEAMERLGYIANLHARSLAGGRSQLIGVLMTDVSNPFVGEVARGITEVLADSQYESFIYTSQLQKGKEERNIIRLIQHGVDGLLLVVPINADAYLNALRQRQIPYVLIDYEEGVHQDVPAIGTTNWQGGYDATKYLIGLGHRRIGFITGHVNLGSAQQRLLGYKSALASAGIPLDETLIFEGNFTREAGYSGTQALLALPQPPTAIFASNDHMALGAMRLARELQLDIPRDLSLVGFDDGPLCPLVHPPLTTVRQPMVDFGRVATRMLLEYINNPDEPIKRVTMRTEMIIRASCCPPRTV